MERSSPGVRSPFHFDSVISRFSSTRSREMNTQAGPSTSTDSNRLDATTPEPSRSNDNIPEQLNADRHQLNRILRNNYGYLSMTQGTGKSKSRNYVLKATHPFRIAWDIFILLLLIYVALVSVVIFSFLGRLTPSSPWFWIERFLDVCFSIDIVLNFFTSYKTKHYEDAPDTFKETATKYLATFFLFDVIATVPWDALPHGDEGQPSLLNLLRFLRLLRLAKLFRLMSFMRTGKTFTKFEVKMRLKYGYWRLSTLFIVVLLISHWFACLFYFFGSVPVSTNVTLFEAWTEDDSKVPRDGYGRYLMALYFSVYTITTIGYGDVVPGTTVERTYVTIIMLLGAACFAFVISQVSTIVGELSESSAAQRRMIDALTDFARVRRLPEDLAVDIRMFFQHYFSHKRVADEKALLEVMSNGLRQRVLRHMYGEYIRKTMLFEDLDEFRLDELHNNVEESVKHEDDVLFNVGETASVLYIVKNGSVVLTDGVGEEVTVKNGEAIGSLDMVLKRRRKYKATVAENSEILKISREAIMNALSWSPKTLQELRNKEAANLWQESLQVMRGRVHFGEMAEKLQERTEELLPESGGPEEGTRAVEEEREGSGGTGGTGGTGESRAEGAKTDTGEVEDRKAFRDMRRELERKTERIRELEARLVELQNELGGIVSKLKLE